MKVHQLLAAAVLALASVTPARAQPLARVDVAGIVGWFNANKSDVLSYDDWYNRSAYGGIELGWYWTDQIKTEIEVGITSSPRLYSAYTADVDGQRAYGSSTHRFNTRRFAVGQQYQFLRNAWVHPHASVGLDLTWETRRERREQLVLFDQGSRTSRVIQPAQTIGPTIDLEVRPFAEVGAKLYVSRRAFFRTDLRLTFRDRVEEVVLRFGAGVDF